MAETDRRASLVLLAAAAVIMSYVVGAGPALAHIALALVLTALAVLPVPAGWLPAGTAAHLGLGVLAGGILGQVAKLLTIVPGFFLEPSAGELRSFRLGVAVGGVLAVLSLVARPGLGRALFVLLVFVHAWLGAWVIQQSPSPGIDVYVWQNEALDSLLRGSNPYEAGYPELLPGTYPDELVSEGRVHAYTYSPLTLLLTLPARLWGGDIRYAYLLAIEGSALLMAFTRPGRLSRAAGAIFLLTPGLLVVLQLSWTEPFATLFLSAAIFAACRRSRRLLPVMFGLTVVTKQYMVLLVALVHLLFGRPFDLRRHLRRLVIAGSVAAVTTLPWLLLGPRAFWNGMVILPLKTPFREDSISFPALLVRSGGMHLPAWVGLAAAAAAWFLTRGVRWTPSGFAASSALVLGSLFVWSGHSFSNYYFLVLAALCCAVSAWSVETGSAEDSGDAAVAAQQPGLGDTDSRRSPIISA